VPGRLPEQVRHPPRAPPFRPSASVRLHTTAPRISSAGQAGYLDGASRYLLDVSGSAPSVAYNETLTQFASIKAYSAYGAVQHWWTDTIRSNFLYSFVRIDNPIFSGPAVIRETQYGVANLMYSPWPEVDVGVEFQYGQRTDADGRKGSQTRVQSSLIYRF
jgi:hypothetical protein